jgi:hypothetical protein
MRSVCDECVQVRSDELNNFVIEGPQGSTSAAHCPPAGQFSHTS